MDDILQLSDWLNRDEKNRLRLKQLKKFWDTPVKMEKPELSFEQLFTKMDSRHKIIPKTKRSGFSSRMRIISAAAAVALLLIIGSIVFMGRKTSLSTDYYAYHCINGVDRITLPDSTVVYLNKGGKLTYASDYKENRRVSLTGEAYFDVMKADGVFTVNLYKDAAIEVLGTRFNVQTGNNRIVTTLEEGSVRFVRGGQFIPLTPDQQLVYDMGNSVYVINQVDPDMYTAWKEYMYKYNGITLQELCKELKRIYKVEIFLSSKLRNVKVSGSFEYRHDVEQILDVMKKRMQFEWRREGNKIWIN